MEGIFWDSNLFIYLIEQHPQFFPKLRAILDWQQRHQFRSITSMLTVGEALVMPLRLGNDDLLTRYRDTFLTIPCVSFGTTQAERFAELRARHPSLKPADAIQLSCASTYQVRYFLTNDSRLSHLSVSGIGKVLSLAEWRPELNGERDDA